MRSVPTLPRLLGLAGLLPQLACLIVAFLGPAEWAVLARSFAALYAALIFTFLGGTWWGIAAAAPAAERRGGLRWIWFAAVVPSLLAAGALAGWLSGTWPIEPALVTLGAGLLMALGVDARIAPLSPRWWMRLRAPLSILLGAATIAIAFA